MNETELPYYLREDSQPAAQCDQCGRKSWDPDMRDRRCGMSQPDGSNCEGTMRRVD